MLHSRTCPTRKAICSLAALHFSLTPFAQASESQNADLIGNWRLIKVLDSSEITSIDDREAARLIGKTLTIRRDQVAVNGQSCDDPEFERHKESAARYIREQAHAPVGRLGLPDTITVVDLSCAHAILKSPGRMVLYWQGFFFDVTKLPSGRKGKTLGR